LSPASLKGLKKKMREDYYMRSDDSSIEKKDSTPKKKE
jgi:hypothetical protein